MGKPVKRCVNVDWVEVYALESNMRYPVNADYFRSQGLFVREREYGTRVWKEMFEIEDEHGEPWIEVRRNPASGDSKFNGLNERSVHLRLKNWYCYTEQPVTDLMNFMALHDYEFRRIFRIDICYDFTQFDSGDNPEKFARRYVERKYSKINQCKVAFHGNDGWATFDWESLSWGAPKSMIGTKMYNKTKEMAQPDSDKPYIRRQWFDCGVVDNPLHCPDVWRVEFSLKSIVDGWIRYEKQGGKKVESKLMPHRLSMFDTRDKLWQRFEELAFHYFHFRHVEHVGKSKALVAPALESIRDNTDLPLKSKKLCRDKFLFNFNLNREFLQVQGVPHVSRPDNFEKTLRSKLVYFREHVLDMNVRKSIDVIVDFLDDHEVLRLTPHGGYDALLALKLAIATRTGWPMEVVKEKAEEIAKLIKEKEIW